METNRLSKKARGYIITLLLASLIFFGWVFNLNSNLKNALNAEKLKQDSVLSTKLLLDKEIFNLTTDINNLKGKNAKLDSILAQANKELDVKQLAITTLKKENATVKSLKKELQKLKDIRNNLNKQLDEQLAENMQLISENRQLKSKLKDLETEIAEAKANANNVTDGYTANNFRIELQKKRSEKLTVKSKKARNIQLHFDLKNNNGSSSEQTLYVKITDPAGNVVSPYITPVVINDQKIVYTLSEKINLTSGSKNVIIDFKPETKLKQKGVYKIMVYHPKEGLIGSSEIRTN